MTMMSHALALACIKAEREAHAPRPKTKPRRRWIGVAALRADPETSVWAREKGDAKGGREFRRIWEKAAPTADWLAEAQQDKAGEPLPNLVNAMLALRGDPALSATVAYDEMMRAAIRVAPTPGSAEEPFAARPVRDTDVAAVQEHLQRSGLRRLGKDTLHQAVDLRAPGMRVSPRPRLPQQRPMGRPPPRLPLACRLSRHRGQPLSRRHRADVPDRDGGAYARARLQSRLRARAVSDQIA
jgi:hypothetical protein